MHPTTKLIRQETAREKLIEELSARANEGDAKELKSIRQNGRLRDVYDLYEMEKMVEIAGKLPPALVSVEDAVAALREASDEDLLNIRGIGPAKLEDIRRAVG